MMSNHALVLLITRLSNFDRHKLVPNPGEEFKKKKKTFNDTKIDADVYCHLSFIFFFTSLPFAD